MLLLLLLNLRVNMGLANAAIDTFNATKLEDHLICH